jgi:hypothetical protein
LSAGQALRITVPLLGALGFASPGGLGMLIANLAGLVPAAAELWHIQHCAHQAAAARTAANKLRRLADRTRQSARVPGLGRRMSAMATASQDHAEHPRQPEKTRPSGPGNDR